MVSGVWGAGPELIHCCHASSHTGTDTRKESVLTGVRSNDSKEWPVSITVDLEICISATLFLKRLIHKLMKK